MEREHGLKLFLALFKRSNQMPKKHKAIERGVARSAKTLRQKTYNHHCDSPKDEPRTQTWRQTVCRILSEQRNGEVKTEKSFCAFESVATLSHISISYHRIIIHVIIIHHFSPTRHADIISHIITQSKSQRAAKKMTVGTSLRDPDGGGTARQHVAHSLKRQLLNIILMYVN